MPTPEPLWVDPVISPTGQLSQTIVVWVGNGEQVSVESESGTFTVPGRFDAYFNPARVVITLLPDTVHHLRVIAWVRRVPHPSGCIFGGYTFSTTSDRYGAPLVIEQRSSYP